MDKGTAEKLLDRKEIKEDDSKNLTGEELTLEIKDSDVVINKEKNMLEIADVNGSFGLWIKLDEEKLNKIKGP